MLDGRVGLILLIPKFLGNSDIVDLCLIVIGLKKFCCVRSCIYFERELLLEYKDVLRFGNLVGDLIILWGL